MSRGRRPPRYGSSSQRRRGNRVSNTWWGRLPPGVKAAFTMAVPVLLVQLVNAFTFGLALTQVFFVQAILYVVNGMVAGKNVKGAVVRTGYSGGIRNARVRQMINKEAGIAGFALSLIALLIYVLVALAWGMVSFGIAGMAAAATILICGPADITISIILAILGGWIYDKWF